MVAHTNKWVWGETVTLIGWDGEAMVEMSFQNDNKGVCYISGLSVVESQRRRGKATILMNECFNVCKKRGIFRIDLNSVMEPFVMDFYHKLGFKDVKENEGFMLMHKMLISL